MAPVSTNRIITIASAFGIPTVMCLVFLTYHAALISSNVETLNTKVEKISITQDSQAKDIQTIYKWLIKIDIKDSIQKNNSYAAPQKYGKFTQGWVNGRLTYIQVK